MKITKQLTILSLVLLTGFVYGYLLPLLISYPDTMLVMGGIGVLCLYTLFVVNYVVKEINKAISPQAPNEPSEQAPNEPSEQAPNEPSEQAPNEPSDINE